MQVNVKGQKYKVKYVDKIDNDESILGQCSGTYKVLLIKKRKNYLSVCETICHELMHAIINECGVGEMFEEEKLCYWIEKQILTLLDGYIDIHNFIFPDNKIELKERVKK